MMRTMSRSIIIAIAVIALVVSATTATKTATATATTTSSASSSTTKITGSSLLFRQQQQRSQEEEIEEAVVVNANKKGRWLKEDSLPSLHHRQLQNPQSTSLQNLQSRNRKLQSSNNKKTAMKTCELAAQEEEDNIFGTSSINCVCTEIKVDERYSDFLNINDQPLQVELECIDTRCSYCSTDGTTCDKYSYGSIYEEIPRTSNYPSYVAQVSYYETNQYIEGRSEAVIYTEYYDPLASDLDSDENSGVHSCSMDIDGLRCAVCEYIDCISDDTTEEANNLYYGLRVVCSNIKIGDGLGGYVTAQDFETCNQEQINGIGSTQGVFEMYDDEYGQCYTAETACDRDTLELDNDTDNSYYTCQCKDNQEANNNANSPFLLDVKLRCEKKTNTGLDGITDCSNIKEDSISRTYSSYAIETETRTIKFEDDKTVRIEQFDCETTSGSSSKGCDSCTATINGQECTSCTMIACNTDQDGNADLVPRIACGNVIDPSATSFPAISMCYSSNESIVNTPFEYFGQGSQCGGCLSVTPEPVVPDNDRDIQPPQQEVPSPVVFAGPVSRMACEEKLRELGSRQNYVDGALMVCVCNNIGDVDEFTTEIDTGSLLSCTTNNGGCGTTNGGSICNAVYGNFGEDKDGAVCFREELVQGFLPDGNKTPLTRTTTYTHGKIALEDSLIGHTLTLTEYENDSNSCQLLIDGIACNSCQLDACDGIGIGIRPIVDCSNVIADDTTFELNSCDAFTTYEEGLLVRLASGASGSDNEFTNFNVCSNEFTSSAPDQQLDPSLSTTCQLAQPILLASQQDVASSAAITRSTDSAVTAAFVSLNSSTDGLPAIESTIQSCTGEENSSPSLWYKLNGDGQGVHASVCREPTNFDARISVYSSSSISSEGSSSCSDGNNINCVAGTYSPSSDVDANIVIESICDVHWVAKEDTTYYIRIHGSTTDQTGDFNLFIQTIPDDHIDTCSRTDETDNTTTSLNQACLKCAKEKSNMVNSGDMDCQCIEKTSNTGGYHLTCVDVGCLKCNNPTQDLCGFNTFELDIQSTGKVEAPNYESFYVLNNNSNNQEDAIAIVANIQKQDTNNKCIDINDPYQTCMVSRDQIMMSSRDDEPEKVFCECRGTSEEGDFMLLCTLYDAFEYCTGDDCANVLFGQTISQYGYVTTEFRKFDFVNTAADEGSDGDSIVVEQTETGCSVSVNGQQCTKCELAQCDSNNIEDTLLGDIYYFFGRFTDMSFDCSNVMEGDDTNNTTTTSTFECGIVGGNGGDGMGLLSILVGDWKENIDADVGEEEQQQQTIPPDAFPPTMPPVTQPTSAPAAFPVVDGDNTLDDNDNNSTTPISLNPTSNNTDKDESSSGDEILPKTNEAIDAWKEGNESSAPVATAIGTFVVLSMIALSIFLV